MATAGAVKMRKADVGTPLTSGTAVAKSFSTSFLTRSLGGSGSAVYKHSIRQPNMGHSLPLHPIPDENSGTCPSSILSEHSDGL